MMQATLSSLSQQHLRVTTAFQSRDSVSEYKARSRFFPRINLFERRRNINVIANLNDDPVFNKDRAVVIGALFTG